MPRLVAEITADTKGLETGLHQADGMIEKFGHKVKHHLIRSFGYGFLATASVEAIKKNIEMAEHISEGAAKLKISTDEYQGLQEAAKKASLGVEEFVEMNKKNGVVLERQIVNLGNYRNAIKMTTEEIEEFKEMKETAGMLVQKGITGPIGFAGRKAWNLVAGTQDLWNAVQSLAWGGKFMGESTEDWLFNALKQGAEYRNQDMTWFRDTGSAALDLPAGTRLKRRQHAIAKKTAELNALVADEKGMLSHSDPRTAWLAPGVTDWQSMGAMTRIPSVLVSDQERNHQEQVDLLTEIRNKIAETKDAIDKLNRGE